MSTEVGHVVVEEIDIEASLWKRWNHKNKIRKQEVKMEKQCAKRKPRTHPMTEEVESTFSQRITISVENKRSWTRDPQS